MAGRLIGALRRLLYTPDSEAAPDERDAPSALTRGEDDEPIRIPIAGVAYENRYRTVKRLAVGELVRLRREPGNEFDPNAVSVETRTGERLGYVGRNVAITLAPFMDARGRPLEAVVTTLTIGASTRIVGAAVTFYLPAGFVDKIRGQASGWDAHYDNAPDGATRVLLDCDEAEATRVYDALLRNGFHVRPPTFWYGAASNGRQYRWYVRMEDGPGSQMLDQVLNSVLGASRRFIDENNENKWFAEEFDRDNAKLRLENSELRKQNKILTESEHALQQRLDSAARNPPKSRRHELDTVFDTLLPRIDFIRNSRDVMERELKNSEPLLCELRDLCWEPTVPQGTVVEGAPKWQERRFITGQKDDGRLYFRKRDGRWMVLVSFKQSQQRDVKYLKAH